ncbi:apolipoprotein N-acyltransferase [soil metagenome]
MSVPASAPRARGAVAIRCLVAGLLLAASIPPFGFWPTALVGLILLTRLLADQPAVNRFRRGWLVAAALLFPTLVWMKDLTLPGYVIACVLYAAMFGIAFVAVPPGRGRWVALPGAYLLAEAVRSSWPFGGVPLSTLAMGQAAGPLLPVARLGGALLLIAVTVTAGVAMAAALRRAWVPALAAASVVLVVLAASLVAPRGTDTGERIEIALVQGGGRQGTRAADTDEREVFERHLEASDLVDGPVDLVLWPENVVNVEGLVDDNPEGDELAALARDLDATLVVGAVEGLDDRFINEVIAYGPDGTVVDRHQKVQRVPFGEWVPFRSLLEPIAGDSLPPRDAIAGDEPAVIDTPAGHFGVVISWEVFFGHRARDAIGNGGEVLLNPTNVASFSCTLVQTQQVASSQLRAVETGRWVLQAAPTGLSAIVTPEGHVVTRTDVSEQRVIQGTVAARTGRTIATRVGDWPALALALAAVAAAWAIERWRPDRRMEEDGRCAGDRAEVPATTGGSRNRFRASEVTAGSDDDARNPRPAAPRGSGHQK